MHKHNIGSSTASMLHNYGYRYTLVQNLKPMGWHAWLLLNVFLCVCGGGGDAHARHTWASWVHMRTRSSYCSLFFYKSLIGLHLTCHYFIAIHVQMLKHTEEVAIVQLAMAIDTY